MANDGIIFLAKFCLSFGDVIMLWNGKDAELTDETGGRKVWKNFAASRELIANVDGNVGFVLVYGEPVSNT